MQDVIHGLLGYLKEGVPAAQIIISQVFNFEPDRATTGFTHLLQEVAQLTGTHFLNVPWSEAEHSQTKKKHHKSTSTRWGLLGHQFFFCHRVAPTGLRGCATCPGRSINMVRLDTFAVTQSSNLNQEIANLAPKFTTWQQFMQQFKCMLQHHKPSKQQGCKPLRRST